MISLTGCTAELSTATYGGMLGDISERYEVVVFDCGIGQKHASPDPIESPVVDPGNVNLDYLEALLSGSAQGHSQ